MQKSLTLMTLLAAGMMLPGPAPAQTPAATTTTPAAQTPADAPVKAPATAKKSTTTTGASKTGAAKAGTTVTLKTQKEKTSYALGMNIGTGLHKQGVTMDPALVAKGLRDAMTGGKTLMSEDEARAALTQLQTEVREKMQAKSKAEADVNRKAGDAFLAANKGKDGVVTTASGLQYKILKEGTGPKPTTTDTVSCNYKGTFTDGKEFDSSKGTPVSFPVNGVIKGWTEALQLMPVGSKWQLWIPGDLAYGDGGRPGIPPASTLVFEVELVSIAPAEKK